MTSPSPPAEGSGAVPTSVAHTTGHRRVRPAVRIGLAALLVLLGVDVLYTALNLPHRCGLFAREWRHGLPCEVPLPPRASFLRYPGSPGQDWVFRVPHMSGPDLRAFFLRQLPAYGWRCVQDRAEYSKLEATRDGWLL